MIGIIILSITYVYAAMHLLVGVIQLAKRKVPILNSVLFITGSMSILLIEYITQTATGSILLLTIGFILIQIGAILNGLHMYGKITISHHLVRFAFFLVIMFTYIPFC